MTDAYHYITPAFITFERTYKSPKGLLETYEIFMGSFKFASMSVTTDNEGVKTYAVEPISLHTKNANVKFVWHHIEDVLMEFRDWSCSLPKVPRDTEWWDDDKGGTLNVKANGGSYYEVSIWHSDGTNLKKGYYAELKEQDKTMLRCGPYDSRCKATSEALDAKFKDYLEV